MTRYKTRNVKRMIFRALSVQTFISFGAFYLGVTIYFATLDELLPQDYESPWGDVAVTSIMATIVLIPAAIVGRRLAEDIVSALPPIAAATHSIAAGDYSVRVTAPPNSFEETYALTADINAMAERLEELQVDLKYWNSAIAHEFRTSATVLLGNLRGLSTGVIEPSPELFARMIPYVNFLTSMANDLEKLDFSGANKLDLNIKEIDLAVEAETLTASTEHDLVPASIKIKRQFDRAVCLADPERMQQLLRLLLDNCRRYAPGSTVTVQTYEDEDWAVMVCADTGPGLSAAVRDRASDRNWRGRDSPQRVPEGRGLGLAIVKTIVNAHHGELSIDTDCGRGFKVTILLPKHASGVERV
ncbi:sensor histidine kinase (plasmid) [Rhizobium leguminosarum]|uniref:histidine kinase n=1 Tax=Rhizobium brockwellii TaxID=3019932 RepID=A0ABU3YY70_9HYPH|nr:MULTISPECIES: HAMP domain-containing sensor histidine kinase [Rhizobium]MDV4183781.1 HAMP domain-containing sensor histidine kinase [Rhizobium brockwellii]MDV4190773.1 HAMP domain-containing sensor histidine kinase [Rhizobium brockwellii]NZD54828.1 HAMP domain-containing histidine kinase [Rhizobium leguminosarum]QIO63465.1 HAMP domain-containing histidine kinase [Rhizobium leguminosarum bv. trifolii]